MSLEKTLNCCTH